MLKAAATAMLFLLDSNHHCEAEEGESF